MVFGVFALSSPGAALLSLVLVFGIYALADGVTALVFAFRKNNPHRGWSIFQGGIGILAGLAALVFPGTTAIALYVMIASWAVLSGIATVVIAIGLRKQLRGEGWLIAHGLLTVAFGVLMVALPAAGVVALISLIAAFAFIAGGVWIAFGIKLARLRKAPPTEGRIDLTAPMAH